MTKQLTLADLTDAERERIAVCFHEAGHAVANVLLGGRITAAVIGDGKTFGVAGQTTHHTVPDGAWPKIVYAGPYAEARWIAGRRPTQRDVYRVLDTSGQRDDKALCAAGSTMNSAPTLAAAGVVPLLDRCWPSVGKVAGQLFQYGEIHHDDVTNALGIPETDNGHHLALIRSGSAPGSFTVRPALV